MNPETKIERLLVGLVEACGGLCYKFVSPGQTGVPDRIVIAPDGVVVFVELKADNGQLSKRQAWQIQRLKEHGAIVYVLEGAEEVRAFVRRVFGCAV